MYDVILSSGYLAFGRQIGFLRAVEEVGLAVDGVCGTSSGALTGGLWAAGVPSDKIAEILTSMRPWDAFPLHRRPWEGLFTMREVIRQLSELVPPRFEDLKRPLGIGVITLDSQPVLLTQGPLPEAIAASCAIPWMFAPVQVGDTWYLDGGRVDRTALGGWRAFRGERPSVVHLVERSIGSTKPPDLRDLPVVHSKASEAGVFGLGNFGEECERTRQRALEVLQSLMAR